MCIYNQRKALERVKAMVRSERGLQGHKVLRVQATQMDSGVWRPLVVTGDVGAPFELPAPWMRMPPFQYSRMFPRGYHFYVGVKRWPYCMSDPEHLRHVDGRRDVVATVWASLHLPVACGLGRPTTEDEVLAAMDAGEAVQVAVRYYKVCQQDYDLLRRILEAVMQPQAEDYMKMLKDIYDSTSMA